MTAQDKKNKSIAEAVRAIHKQFGSGSIMRLDGDRRVFRDSLLDVDPDDLGQLVEEVRARHSG